MFLDLIIYSNHLGIKFINPSSQAMRLWELENSWGWYSISLQVIEETAKNLLTVKRKTREWTENAPEFFVLQPGESREMRMEMQDGWWDMSGELHDLHDRPVIIRAVYTVDKTPESDSFGVFTGVVYSDWVHSVPPHEWLFKNI